MSILLEGKTLADKIKEDVKEQVEHFNKAVNKVPGLIGVLVGENRASQIYLGSKERASRKLGINSEIVAYPENTEASFLKAEIKRLNDRENVDGIIVQLPLPSHLSSYDIVESISPDKDVDGLHPFNLGNLLLNQEGLRPCTPLGIMELLRTNNITIAGKRVVVIGRSLLVGKPLAAMMTNEHGTVTVCHSKTENLPKVASEADILVAAIGRGTYVTPEFVRPGATVVDVGINHLTDPKKVEEFFGKDEKRENDLKKKGYTIIGDVHPRVAEKAEYLTPVPGGVGLLTVAMLMRNTVEVFKRRHKLKR